MGPEIAIASAVGGSLLGAVGSLFGGNAKSQEYQFQAGIAKMNKDVAAQNKEWALRAGEKEALQAGMKTRFAIGSQKTQQAAGNLDVNFGSPVAVRESQREVGLIDQTTIRENAGRRAYGFDVEAANLTAQMQMYNTAAKNAETAGYIGAVSSILGGASSVSGKWAQGSQIGMFGKGGEGGVRMGG